MQILRHELTTTIVHTLNPDGRGKLMEMSREAVSRFAYEGNKKPSRFTVLNVVLKFNRNIKARFKELRTDGKVETSAEEDVLDPQEKDEFEAQWAAHWKPSISDSEIFKAGGFPIETMQISQP
jgi:hypothetical protein